MKIKNMQVEMCSTSPKNAFRAVSDELAHRFSLSSANGGGFRVRSRRLAYSLTGLGRLVRPSRRRFNSEHPIAKKGCERVLDCQGRPTARLQDPPVSSVFRPDPRHCPPGQRPRSPVDPLEPGNTGRRP